MLKVEHVSGGYGERTIINDVSFSVRRGEFFGVIGPNGSGKSTLLKMVSGVHPLTRGSIMLNGKQLASYSAKERAKVIAVLPQSVDQAYTYTVEEIVALGRYAYQTELFKTLSLEDKKK